MTQLFSRSRWALLVLLVALTLTAIGCSSTESENLSSRPWNSPQDWETGSLPSSMNEGH